MPAPAVSPAHACLSASVPPLPLSHSTYLSSSLSSGPVSGWGEDLISALENQGRSSTLRSEGTSAETDSDG